ncbi:hypothetical protein AB5I41_07785 [Sphingomonas sp. MMS24-JH45]
MTISETINGIGTAGRATSDGLTIIGGAIKDGYEGISVGNGLFTNALIQDVAFSNLTSKGIYAEELSD